MNWTLSKNGGPLLPLSAWSIPAITLNRKSFDTDELVFSTTRRDCLATPLFQYGDSVSLWADGTIRFFGYIRTDTTVGDDKTEQQTYGAWNCWDDLKCITYQQTRWLINPGDFVTRADRTTTQVVLFRDPTFVGPTNWAPWTVLQQLQNALAFAEANGVNMAHDFGATVDIQAPWSEATDIMCASVARRCQANMLDLMSWCDYSTTPPTLRFVRRANASTLNLNLTDGTIIEKIDRLRQRSDLIPAGIVMLFLTSVTDPGTGLAYTVVQQSTYGATFGPRVIFNTIDLSALENSDSFYITPLPGLIRNMAEEYYHTLQTPWFDGQIVLRAAECPGTWRPGMLLTFTNGRPDWNAAGGVIQEVSEELLTGRTILRFGPPPIMDGAQFATLALQTRILRQGSPPAIGGGSASKGGTTPTAGGGSSVKLTLCGGASITVLTGGGS